MSFSESPIMNFFRSMVLLAVLIALPGIAICWDHLPKNLWSSTGTETSASKREQPLSLPHPQTSCELRQSASVPETLPLKALPETVTPQTLPTIPQTAQPDKTVEKSAVQQTAWEFPQPNKVRNYESLEFRLKALGAKYYRLEKWGNRGELFRFSCFVTPSGHQKYEKYFQAIGPDEVAVMETVLKDIENWKNETGKNNMGGDASPRNYTPLNFR